MAFALLQKCDGPPCPHCGCEDTELVTFSVRWGATLTKQQCNHCGGTFTVPEEKQESGNGEVEEVSPPAPPKRTVYQPIRCPEFDGGCGSINTKVTSTRRPVRHHKCRDCGKNFKSTEES